MRKGFKHGSWRNKPNPHIDQEVYVTKSGKEEASKVDKDSVMKTKNQRGLGLDQRRRPVVRDSRINARHGGRMCAQIKGFGKARRPKKK